MQRLVYFKSESDLKKSHIAEVGKSHIWISSENADVGSDSALKKIHNAELQYLCISSEKTSDSVTICDLIQMFFRSAFWHLADLQCRADADVIQIFCAVGDILKATWTRLISLYDFTNHWNSQQSYCQHTTVWFQRWPTLSAFANRLTSSEQYQLG